MEQRIITTCVSPVSLTYNMSGMLGMYPCTVFGFLSSLRRGVFFVVVGRRVYKVVR